MRFEGWHPLVRGPIGAFSVTFIHPGVPRSRAVDLLVVGGDPSFAALQWLDEHDVAKIPPVTD